MVIPSHPYSGKKIKRGLSAGRVQSVAVRLLVERERLRRAFTSGEYWDLKALLEHKQSTFEAKLITLDEKRLATGSDFDPNTGKVAEDRDVVLLNEAETIALKERIQDKTWEVTNREERPTTRKPAPPFTTSTLQQESNRKLGISARDTMRIAQRLYEQGYITYMRTDSVHLSEQAIAAARSCVEKMYGKKYLSPSPRKYKNKNKGAQEAHEAIRPAGNTFRTPKQTGLIGRELSLYDLIWKRTVASQMAEARITQITVNVKVENAGFRSSGKRIDFPGFFRAYVEGSDDPEAALENQEVILPPLKVGDKPTCKELEVVGHETQPPARYSEASLVKTLESEGIGRPSTYASIIGTIVDRGYIIIRNKALIPTFTAFAVTSLLEQNFSDLVNTNFTSQMEQTLDEIATGEADWLPYMESFYLGEKGLYNLVKVGEEAIDPSIAKAVALDNLQAKVKIGKYGPYLEIPNGEETIAASIPEDLTPADLSPEQVEILVRQKIEGPDKLGLHPETGDPIYFKTGPYGPYVQLGDKDEDSKKKPKQVSLPKGVKPEEATLEMALGLLALPRLLGVNPETGGKIKASLGRFGPYVVHEFKDEENKAQKDYRSLKAEDDVLTVDLERALELLAQPKRSRAGGKKKPLRELGPHPEDKEPVNVYKGPYGNYVKHGKVNAGLPEGETVEGITLEKALELLAAKASTKKKTTAKKKTTTAKKKTTSKTKKKSSTT